MNIEVEIRSFISEQQYNSLLIFFKKNSKFIKEDYQETFYFDFNWDGITVCLDFTKGYGYIIELEKICSEEEKDKELKKLKEKIATLNINITPKEEFDKKFEYYKKNWKEL